jgi:aryl carrier-like protein
MAKKQKNQEVELRPQEPVRELTNEEKELIRSAVRLVIAKRRRGAIMITLVTLAKHVELLLPFAIDTKTLIEYIKAELVKDYKLITLQDRIGNDMLHIEAVLLFNTIEELISEFKQQKVDTIIKLIDASLDSIELYKQNQ